jgi:hypothetical protein
MLMGFQVKQEKKHLQQLTKKAVVIVIPSYAI